MSSTDMDEPIFEIPKTENVEPRRAKERSDNDEPRVWKSITEMDDPKRDNPNTENVDPQRANDRIDKAEPK